MNPKVTAMKLVPTTVIINSRANPLSPSLRAVYSVVRERGWKKIRVFRFSVRHKSMKSNTWTVTLLGEDQQ